VTTAMCGRWRVGLASIGCAGDWGVLFSLDDGGRIMAIARVLNRRDAYRG
jgi:hypothetical protein